MALAIGIGRCSLNHQQKPLSSSEWDWDVHLSFQVLDVTPILIAKVYIAWSMHLQMDAGEAGIQLDTLYAIM